MSSDQLPPPPPPLPSPPSPHAAKITMAYIESIANRFASVEKSLSDDVQRLEDRLGQVVELMTSVSALQSQVHNHQKILTELRQLVKTSLDEINTLVGTTDQKYAAQVAVLGRKVVEAASVHDDKYARIEERLDASEHRQRTWLNRGVGAWVVMSVLVGLVEYGGVQWLQDAEEEKVATHAAVAKAVDRISDLEFRLQMLEHSQPLTNKKP